MVFKALCGLDAAFVFLRLKLKASSVDAWVRAPGVGSMELQDE